MLSLRHFLLLLAILLVLECAGTQPPNSLLGSASLTVGGSAVIGWFWGRLQSRSATQADAAWPAFRTLTAWIPVLAWPAVLLLTGWVAWAKSLAHGHASETLCHAALFLPLALFYATYEAAWTELEPSSRAAGESWFAAYLKRIRLSIVTGLGLCLVPVFMITGLVDLVRYVAPNSISASLLIGAAVLLVLLLALPWLLSRWAGTQALESSSLGNRIEHYRQSLGLSALKLELVPAQGRWHSAAVIGWVPGTRRLWIGDSLTWELDRRQLDMVILHELAHLQKRHFACRSLPMLWAGGIGVACLVSSHLVASDVIGARFLQMSAYVLSALALVVGLGVVSHQCEYEADVIACQLALQLCPWAKHIGQAEAVLAATLSSLLGDRPSTRSWLHPSLRDRLNNLAGSLVDHRSRAAAVAIESRASQLPFCHQRMLQPAKALQSHDIS